MSAFLITYDVRGNRLNKDYKLELLTKSLDGYDENDRKLIDTKLNLTTTFLIKSNKTTKEIYDECKEILGPQDELVVVEVSSLQTDGFNIG